MKSILQKIRRIKVWKFERKYIEKVINEILKEKYENIFKGPYEREEKYVPKNKTIKCINDFYIIDTI